LWTGLRRPDLAARTVVCVHSPLSAEGGPSWRAREAAALAGVASVVATGGPTARDLKAMGVPSQRLVPGTRPAHRTRAPERPGPLHVVMLCTLTPRKALHRALDALRAVPDARLTVAGSTERDPTEAERLRARVHELGLGERVRWAGELDDRGVDALLAEAHLLLHTARYEAWGMALTEAMARGVPVLTTPAGAAEEGGAWVLPAEALPDALATLDTDRDRLRALADDAWRRGRSLPTWPDQARRLLPLLPETR
jgi:glycosyltransferase involved in cell wall biosynthesis